MREKYDRKIVDDLLKGNSVSVSLHHHSGKRMLPPAVLEVNQPQAASVRGRRKRGEDEDVKVLASTRLPAPRSTDASEKAQKDEPEEGRENYFIDINFFFYIR